MTWTLVIIIGLKYFGLWFWPNELLVGRVIIFGVRANHQSEVCDEFRLNLSLDDKTSKTSLISSGVLGLCVCLGCCVCVLADENMWPKRGESMIPQ